MMSSASIEWCTPTKVLDLVRRVAPIALDPCGSPMSEVGAALGLVPSETGFDGLTADWVQCAGGGLIYCNPPYGRVIGDWVKRCYAAGKFGGECIALLPARTYTSWWQNYCAPPTSEAVCFWRGRLTFLGAPAPAPFPSAIVYWGPRRSRFADVFGDVGSIWL